MDKNLFKSMSVFFVILLSMHSAAAGPIEPFFNKQVANGDIKSISISPDGKYIAILSEDNKIQYFDKNGARIWETQTSNEILRDVATNGEYVVVGSGVPTQKNSLTKERGHVKLYSKSNQLLFDTEISPEDDSMPNPIQNVGISSDGISIIASDSRNVYLLEKSGSILKKTSINGDITDISISSNLIAVSYGSTLSLYDNIGRMIQSFGVESNTVKRISISEDGHIAVLTPQAIYLYQKDKKLWKKNTTYGGFFSSISISIDGNWIAASSTDDGLFIFNKNGESVLSNPTPFKGVSTNGDLIAGIKSGSLYLFDISPYIKGSISVASTQGAEVYLDERLAGTVPITIPNVPVGAHTIKIVKQGYDSWVQNIDISSIDKKEISIALSPSPQTITPTEIPTQTPISTPTPLEPAAIPSKPETNWAVIGGIAALIVLGIIAITKLRTRKVKHDVAIPPEKITPSPTTPKTFPPELLHKYTDIEFLGKGGFARVFKVKRRDGRVIALKTPLNPDEETGKSFLREMNVTSWRQLNHRNIVAVFDANILPTPYLEIEYMEGGNLESLQKPLEIELACEIVFDIAEGLKYAHKLSIIHRDIKPQNILFTKDKIPKITDWGTGRVIVESKSTTQHGYTPAYAAPEQVSPNKFGNTDVRTDIYQLGVIFYYLLTNDLPFKGDDIVEIASAIAREKPKPPSKLNPKVKEVEHIVLKCLSKNKEDRYQNAEEFQQELEKFIKKPCEKSEEVQEKLQHETLRRDKKKQVDAAQKK